MGMSTPSPSLNFRVRFYKHAFFPPNMIHAWNTLLPAFTEATSYDQFKAQPITSLVNSFPFLTKLTTFKVSFLMSLLIVYYYKVFIHVLSSITTFATIAFSFEIMPIIKKISDAFELTIALKLTYSEIISFYSKLIEVESKRQTILCNLYKFLIVYLTKHTSDNVRK